MEHAYLYQHLIDEDTPFAKWLKENFINFPLAVLELVQRAWDAGIHTIGKLSSKRGNEKYALLLLAFFNEGLIKTTAEMIRRSNSTEFETTMVQALAARNKQLIAQNVQVLRLGTLDTIPDSEFMLIKRSF